MDMLTWSIAAISLLVGCWVQTALGFGMAVIAAPIAYGVMNLWLEEFAYRISLSWSLFLISGLTALTIACLTISYLTIKAALANPIDALRYE